MIPCNSEPCFWRDISSRVDDSVKLQIVMDNAKSHNVRETASFALGLTSTHSRGSGSIVSPQAFWSTHRLSNRWETSSGAKVASPQPTINLSVSDSGSESSEVGEGCDEGESSSAFADLTSPTQLPGLISPHRANMILKAQQDMGLRVPTRRMSDLQGRQNGGGERSPGAESATDSPSSQNHPADTTLKLPKRKPSDEPCQRMMTLLETKTLTLTGMMDIVVDPLLSGAKCPSPIPAIDLPNKLPERKVSDISTASSSSWSSSGRPPISAASRKNSDASGQGSIKRKVQAGPRIPVRKGKLDSLPDDDDDDDDDDEVEEDYNGNDNDDGDKAEPNSEKPRISRESSSSTATTSSSSSKKQHLEKLMDAMLDEFERDPSVLIEQALATLRTKGKAP